MNTLEKYIAESWSDEVKTMNDLQDKGIVSDNCVDAKDVYEECAKKAVAMIYEHIKKSE